MSTQPNFGVFQTARISMFQDAAAFHVLPDLGIMTFSAILQLALSKGSRR
jgi:hypothetical protein